MSAMDTVGTDGSSNRVNQVKCLGLLENVLVEHSYGNSISSVKPSLWSFSVIP